MLVLVVEAPSVGLFCRIDIQLLGLEHADWLETRVDVSG